MVRTESHLNRAANAAAEFSTVMEAEVGSGLRLEALPLPQSDYDRIEAPRGCIQNRQGAYGPFRAIYANQAHLESGLGFGLVTGDGVVPAIISPRTEPTRLHILYLPGAQEAIDPRDIGRPGTEPTTLQRAILQGVSPYQARTVGSRASHTPTGTAGEGGHAMLGIKAVTDSEVKQAIFAGRHKVHSLAESPTGIMPALSQPSTDAPGMLSFEQRPIYPKELIVDDTQGSPRAWLIDHPHYRSLSNRPEGLTEAAPGQVIMGLGMLAAQDQRGLSTGQLRDQLLKVMEGINGSSAG